MKTALSIAGSDSCGGAGIQADIKTMTMNGVYAMTAITALTAQNTTGVRAIQEATPAFLKEQLDAVFEDIFPDAVKTGMVSSIPLIRVIAAKLKEYGAKNLVVDPVMGDNGRAYSTVTPALIDRIRALCQAADLILPNYTEAQLLLQRTPQTEPLTDEAAQALADELTAIAPGAAVTGLPLGQYIGCAGSGSDRFLVKKLHIRRSFPGTGDLYGAVLIGSLLQGNALSAAADNAAEFVALAIQNTPPEQDTRFGVWFEPLLPRLCPVAWND